MCLEVSRCRGTAAFPGAPAHLAEEAAALQQPPAYAQRLVYDDLRVLHRLRGVVLGGAEGWWAWICADEAQQGHFQAGQMRHTWPPRVNSSSTFLAPRRRITFGVWGGGG